MIPWGRKAGRGDTRQNIKSDTYTQQNLPGGKDTAKGISQFIFLFFSLSLTAITSSSHWLLALLAQAGRVWGEREVSCVSCRLQQVHDTASFGVRTSFTLERQFSQMQTGLQISPSLSLPRVPAFPQAWWAWSLAYSPCTGHPHQ